MERLPARSVFAAFIGGLFVALLGAVAVFALWQLVHHPIPVPTAPAPVVAPAPSPPVAVEGIAPTTTEEATSSAPVFQPEIPVNEYWDYATMDGLHIYVNNTDRNVIYALDDTGKIVWTIWGKDYGINGYEIRHNDHLFFVTREVKDALDTWYTNLWVFDVQGRLRWKQTFPGYLDMPQMVVTDTVLMVENRSGDSCDKGCGVMCPSGPAPADCPDSAFTAFDPDTGKLLWKNTTRDLYGVYNHVAGNGDIISQSGGVGPGRWIHTYVVSSTTGVITSHTAIVNDVEYGQDREQLHLDEDQKTIYLTDYYSSTTHWTVHAPDPLYDLIAVKGQQTGLRIYVLGEIILADLGGPGNATWTTYGIDKTSGRILWSTDFDSAGGDSFYWKTTDGVLLFVQQFKSACTQICDTCGGSWICIDTPPPAECKVCQQKEQSAPGYWQNRVWGVDDKTGQVLWKKDFTTWARLDLPTEHPFTTSTTSAVTVSSYENNTSTVRVLDVHTGSVIE